MIYASLETELTPYLFDTAQQHGDGNGYTGYVGVNIKTENKPIMVTHLGRYRITNSQHPNSQLHQVIILKKTTGVRDDTGKPSEIIASAIVDANQSTLKGDNGYNFTRLIDPVVLEPNSEYFIGSYEKAEGDYYLTSGSILPTNSTLWSTINPINTSCAMNPENGTLIQQQTFTPIVNMKAQ